MECFIDQVEKLNKKYGTVLTLEEIEECKKRGEIIINKEGDIDNYVYVHVTDWEPIDDTIKTEIGKAHTNGFIDNSIGPVRDSTHFTVNGRVRSHGDGNWDKRKYGVIIKARDFLKKYGNDIQSLATEDSFKQGNADIKGDILLCPKQDYKMLKSKNPNTMVIPVNNDYVVNVENGNNIDYISRLLSIMDIRERNCEQSGWTRTDGKSGLDFESILKYEKTINEYFGRMPSIAHRDSLLREEERMRANISKMKIDFQQVEDIDKEENFGFIVKCYILKDALEGKGDYTLISVKQSTEKINDMLIDWGMSELDTFNSDDYYVKQKPLESKKIDRFLGINIRDIHKGDIIQTNVERIRLISEKMKEEDSLNDKKSKQILGYAVTHFLCDYRALSGCYSKRIDLQDFDFEEYKKRIKDRFEEIGIRIDEIDNMSEMNIGKLSAQIIARITEEKKTQKLIEEQGYTEEQGQDLALRDIARIKITEKIMKSQIINAIHSGKYDQENGMPLNDDVFNKALDISDKAIGDLIIDNAKTEEREEVNARLSEMGIINTDFSKKENQRILNSVMDERYDRILTEAEQEAAEQKVVASEVEPNTKAPDEISKLKYSYSEGRVGTSDVNGAKVDIKSKVEAQSRDTLEDLSKQ